MPSAKSSQQGLDGNQSRQIQFVRRESVQGSGRVLSLDLSLSRPNPKGPVVPHVQRATGCSRGSLAQPSCRRQSTAWRGVSCCPVSLLPDSPSITALNSLPVTRLLWCPKRRRREYSPCVRTNKQQN